MPEAARRNNRSMNAEIVSRLEQSFAGARSTVVVNDNSAEAGVLWKLPNLMESLQGNITYIKNTLTKRGKKR